MTFELATTNWFWVVNVNVFILFCSLCVRHVLGCKQSVISDHRRLVSTQERPACGLCRRYSPQSVVALHLIRITVPSTIHQHRTYVCCRINEHCYGLIFYDRPVFQEAKGIGRDHHTVWSWHWSSFPICLL